MYGYPFYPFSYGWNPGWYGSGNGYGNYYNNYPGNGYTFGDGVSYGNESNTSQGTRRPPTRCRSKTSATSSGTASAGTAATVSPSTSSVAVRAQITNAVENSPALISADGAVTQAQSQYNASRDRPCPPYGTSRLTSRLPPGRHDAAQAVNAARVGATRHSAD